MKRFIINLIAHVITWGMIAAFILGLVALIKFFIGVI